MPSLKELEDFRHSFQNIGSEATVRSRKGIPQEQLELPRSPSTPPRASATPASAPEPRAPVAEPRAAAADPPSEVDDFSVPDFEDFERAIAEENAAREAEASTTEDISLSRTEAPEPAAASAPAAREAEAPSPAEAPEPVAASAPEAPVAQDDDERLADFEELPTFPEAPAASQAEAPVAEDDDERLADFEELPTFPEASAAEDTLSENGELLQPVAASAPETAVAEDDDEQLEDFEDLANFSEEPVVAPLELVDDEAMPVPENSAVEEEIPEKSFESAAPAASAAGESNDVPIELDPLPLETPEASAENAPEPELSVTDSDNNAPVTPETPVMAEQEPALTPDPLENGAAQQEKSVTEPLVAAQNAEAPAEAAEPAAQDASLPELNDEALAEMAESEAALPEQNAEAPAEAAEPEALEASFPEFNDETSAEAMEPTALDAGWDEDLSLDEEAEPDILKNMGDFTAETLTAKDAFAEIPPLDAESDAALASAPLQFNEEALSEEAPNISAILGDSASEQDQNSQDEAKEILLSEAELAKLQKTLASYPLNLRIACEEVIAEQTIAPVYVAQLVKALADGMPAREAAALVGKIAERIILIPPGFEKKSGEMLEAEQATFTYIFVHKFLPAFRLCILLAVVLLSLLYLGHRFIYTPLHAESLYKLGYERIFKGEYIRANDRFGEAFAIYPKKSWFYKYAEAFRDERQYSFATGKYDELLRVYPRDKKGVLDYADMETNYIFDYKKADDLIRSNILDYAVNDREGLLARGDNALEWGGVDPEKYEIARESFSRYLERYGASPPLSERMLKYFIRTDNLAYVLPLQKYFMQAEPGKAPKTKIAAATLAELGGYLLDKKLEEVRGVPNQFIEQIDGINDILLRAVRLDPMQPEPHYHLARYYNYLDSPTDERIILETALKAFDAAKQESVKHIDMRIDAERHYARLLAANREFIPAGAELGKAINLYENAVERKLLPRQARYGRLYADLGDLAYFTYKEESSLDTALKYYTEAETNGWTSPEMQYRMGSAHYEKREWGPALERFVKASSDIPYNRRILNSLGATAFQRGDFSIAKGHYSRLLDMLERERQRFSMLMPDERADHLELVERLMVARNNLGVTLEALTESTGNNSYRSQALGLYSESARAWDLLSRNPKTMIRPQVEDIGNPRSNQASLNSNNALNPIPGYVPKIYSHIDKDVLEPSWWEELSPQNVRISDPLIAAENLKR
ncbi:MAG: tetratricopeptide repeat protein [Treponema sp.]|jgi:hypothetical protein|nr:tetratricopeptide repeat protein [Treponema sp.]